MIEKLLENWLDRASETSFQTPFCYLLASRGYTVVHLTRHCALEMGKDVIAFDPDGTPCAYQLKGCPGRQITLSQWDSEQLGPQLHKLVNLAINHPSVPDDVSHKAYFVTNREIEEEVSRAMADLQRGWKQNGMPERHFDTITRGQLLNWTKEAGRDLWPDELRDTRDLLEMFLLPGEGPLPKDKFVSLLEQTTGILEDSPGQPEITRRLSSAALVTAIALTPFSEKENHVAHIEAWTLYFSYLCATVERRQLAPRHYKNEMAIAREAIQSELIALATEVHRRSEDGHMGLSEGDAALDFAHLFYRARITCLLGYLSTLALVELADEADIQINDLSMQDFREWLVGFVRSNMRFVFLWGESATPYFLALYWFLCAHGQPSEAHGILVSLLHGVYEASREEDCKGLPSVYQGVEEALDIHNGLTSHTPDQNLRHQTYVLEGLFQLFVRLNFKQEAKNLWPEFTCFTHRLYEVEEPWEFFRWRNRETGHNSMVIPERQQEWQKFKQAAEVSDNCCVPETLQQEPGMVLLLTQVYPHRLNSGVMRWLDTRFREKRKNGSVKR